jgi:hypothetical protein
VYPVVVDGDFEGHGHRSVGKRHHLIGGVRRGRRQVASVRALVLHGVRHLERPEPAARPHQRHGQVAVAFAHGVSRARKRHGAAVAADHMGDLEENIETR